jgi:polyhydroxybutyrate depolymerase
VQGLAGAVSIALSADGTGVYVTSDYDHAVAVFRRDASTGLLTFVQAAQEGVDGVRGLTGAFGAAVSPDGTHLWAAGYADHSIVLFSRDPGTGRLSFVEARGDVLTQWLGMGQVGSPVLSPDGKSLYVGSLTYSALLAFSTDEGGMAPLIRCVGDCDGSGTVTVDKLVKGVNIALGIAPLSACDMFDCNGNGKVTVDCLIKAVKDALSGCVDPLTPGDHRRSLVFGGQSRVYELHIPPGYDGHTPVPLVFDFHGFTSNETFQAGLSGWRVLADSEGFILAYPLGLFGQTAAAEVDTADGPSFNAGPGCCGGAARNGIDDVGFARAIVQAVATEANIDRTRVYATGHSNGGAMASRLSCEAADVFAGVAPVAGFIGVFLCQPSRPIAVIAFAGLDDPVSPYVFSTVGFTVWRNVDGCGSGPPDDRVDIGTSYCETYRNCSAGVQVERCSVNANQTSWGAGHGTYLNPDVDIPQTAWAFLSQFRLCQPACAGKCQGDDDGCGNPCTAEEGAIYCRW